MLSVRRPCARRSFVGGLAHRFGGRRRSALAAVPLMAALAAGLLAAPSGHAEEPGAIHAGNTFGWYPYAQHWEFERWGAPKPLTSDWQTRGRATERGGQLTLSARRGHSTVVTLRGAGHRTGRWELRWHGYGLGAGPFHYRATSSLVPAANAARHCGPQVTFEDVSLPHSQASFTLRPGSGSEYTASTASRGEPFVGRERWHTFAVEVTHRRISWFVDAHVVATETRPAAMVDAPLTVQLRLAPTAQSGAGVARMQLDWLRYWTLRKPDAKSTAAPALHRTTYAARGC
jgi:hypothetical protein